MITFWCHQVNTRYLLFPRLSDADNLLDAPLPYWEGEHIPGVRDKITGHDSELITDFLSEFCSASFIWNFKVSIRIGVFLPKKKNRIGVTEGLAAASCSLHKSQRSSAAASKVDVDARHVRCHAFSALSLRG